MAFLRKVELTIGPGQTGVLISDLHLTFNVERSVTAEYNTAQFTIYNAKEQTRNQILIVGANVVLKAGYEDEGIGIIFIGTVTKSVSYQSGSEWITELEAQDIGNNKQGIEYGTVKLSFAANTPLLSVISQLATLLNVPVTGIENITTILSNGFVYSGNITNLIKRIKGILSQDDLEFYFDQSEMIIYKKYSKVSRFGVVRVATNNGLLAPPTTIIDENEQDGKKRIAFQSLLNFRLRPSAVVNLQSETISGAFIIEKIRFNGDNLGNQFFAEVECVE
jgi:hypothetical protein